MLFFSSVVFQSRVSFHQLQYDRITYYIDNIWINITNLVRVTFAILNDVSHKICRF